MLVLEPQLAAVKVLPQVHTPPAVGAMEETDGLRGEREVATKRKHYPELHLDDPNCLRNWMRECMPFANAPENGESEYTPPTQLTAA